LREILFKLPLNSERLQKLTESYVVSNDMIVKAIGNHFLFPLKKDSKKPFNPLIMLNRFFAIVLLVVLSPFTLGQIYFKTPLTLCCNLIIFAFTL